MLYWLIMATVVALTGYAVYTVAVHIAHLVTGRGCRDCGHCTGGCAGCDRGRR